MKVDWGKFGKYELRADGGNPKSLVGAVAGSSNPDDWRKANFVARSRRGRRCSPARRGSCTLRAARRSASSSTPTALNTPAHPAHSWYKLDGDAVFVEWGKYGQYEFVLDVAKREMNGHLRGNEKSWRRLETPSRWRRTRRSTTAATITRGAREGGYWADGIDLEAWKNSAPRVLFTAVCCSQGFAFFFRLFVADSWRRPQPRTASTSRCARRGPSCSAACACAPRRRLRPPFASRFGATAPQNGRRRRERTGRCGRQSAARRSSQPTASSTSL